MPNIPLNTRQAVQALLGLGLGMGLLLGALMAQAPLTTDDKLLIREAQNKVYETTIQRDIAIRQAQKVHAENQTAIANLQKLEKSLSEKYTKGEKRLNSNLEWVAVEPPSEKPKSKESPI